MAIVGTRRPTRYGESVARELATALARAGACVVSGMALGIDAAAHRAALDAGGATAAVLGAGIDVPYPAGHARLHAEIARRGVVVSEFGPGVAPFRGCFPRRNRIIAALAQVTIVVEAPTRSGALITAAEALELGRTVAAVPGQMDSPQSAGSNQLLRDGALVIASLDDALCLLGLSTARRDPPLLPELAPAEAAVWQAIGSGTADADTVAARANISTTQCLAAVTGLELKGLVESLVTGEFRRRG